MTNTKSKEHAKRIVSAQLSDGRLVELLHDPATETTRFAVFDGKAHMVVEEVEDAGGNRLLPYRAENDILKHRVALFPSEPVEYGTTADLVASIRAYIHTYVDLSEHFELLAAHYVLFTWLYDRFNELPYLRLQGGYGTGKTRFLLVVGSICRTPIFAGGASTTAPIFHMLNRFGGTLIVDEADFRLSDEKAQITKILNNGNVRGFPVLRAESADGKEFSPRAFQVFGPKLIAMRGEFEDRALESRFITERSDRRTPRKDIPINLPARQEAEALQLRNQLLTYRFRNFANAGAVTELVDPWLDGRINQIFSPLLSVMEDEDARAALRSIARDRQQLTEEEQSTSHEAGVLTVVSYLATLEKSGSIPVADIADLYSESHARQLLHPINSRWIGTLLRRAFGLRTRKSHGNYALPTPDAPTLGLLQKRYSISEEDIASIASFDWGRMVRVEPVDGAEGSPPR